MIDFIRKFWKWLIGIIIGGTVLAAGTVYFTPQDVPINLQLKTDKSRIIKSIETDDWRGEGKNIYNAGRMIEYDYATNIEVPAFQDGDLMENISKRGGKHISFDINATTTKTWFFSNLQFAREKVTDKWMQVEKATTTIEAFQIQTQAGFSEKFFVYADSQDFYPDPDVETNTFDGGVRRASDGSTWTSLRAGAGTTAYDSAVTIQVYIGESFSTAWAVIYRGLFLFNTGPTIPAGSTITSATFSLWLSAKADGNTWGANDGSRIAVVQAVTASNVGATITDYENMGVTSFGESDIYNNFTANDTVYTNITINATGIAAIAMGSGVTKFGTRSKYDLSDTDPPGGGTAKINQIDNRSAETADTTKDPKLSVIWTTAGWEFYDVQ